MTTQQHAGRYAEAALRADGTLAKGVAVTVYFAGSGTPAALYLDRNRSAAAANPVTTDPQSGMLTFWAEPGLYDVIGPGVTLTSLPVAIDATDAAALDGSGRVPVAQLPVGTDTGTIAAGDDARITGAEQAAHKGQAGGYAPLDSGGLVPAGYLPGGVGGPVLSVAGRTGFVVLAEADISGLVGDLAAKVATTRQVLAGTGMTGGGDLSADRTLGVVFGTTAGTVMQGNDGRIAGAVQSATTAAATSTPVLLVNLSGDLVSRFGLLADGTIVMGEPALTINAVTGTTTVTVTTSTNHGYGTGDVVVISGVGGISGVNGTRTITRASATTFTLNSTTGSGTYTTGGKAQRQLGNTGATTEGVWNLLMPDTTRDGLIIRGREGSSRQMLMTRDYAGSPIAGNGATGGWGVFGDKLFATNNVFGRTLIGNESGGLRIASGDPAGGVDVVAEGNASTPPTGVPDGSHQGEGSFATGEGHIRWTRNGRPRIRTAAGHEDEIWPVERRSATIAAPGGDTTLVVTGTLPPTVATVNITPTADDQAEGALVRYTTTAATSVDAGLITPLGIVQPRWAPYAVGRLRTDPTAITSTRIAFGMVAADIGSNMGPSVPGAFTTAGAWIRYSSAADGTAFWRTVTCDGANATVNTGSVAIAADTSYLLAVELNAAGTWARFWANGTLLATHTTNLPGASTALGVTARLRTLAASARALRLGRITWSSM